MDTLEHLATIFKALSNEHRVKILKFLRESEGAMGGENTANQDGICVCHIQDAVGLALSTTSQHLKVLKQVGLVRSKKKGKWVYYSIDESGMRRFSSALGWMV